MFDRKKALERYILYRGVLDYNVIRSVYIEAPLSQLETF